VPSAIIVMTVTLGASVGYPCTNFLVTRGASADGSTMITYAADSHGLYGELYFIPAGVHAPGTMIEIHEWDTGKFLGRIPQVPETYSVVGNMNEHQVSIGETTYTGRKELQNPEGIIDYGSLMWLALQRSKTAREAIDVMAALVAEHGYSSTGEAFSIADPNEVWFMVMIGKGKENKGAVWVALKVPDGYVSAHANYSRVGKFPLKDPKNCVYSPDVISFAREKGYYQGEDKDFHFSNAYAPLTWKTARVCEGRVWSFFREVAPSTTPEIDWVHGTLEDVQGLPMWVKPDRKLTPKDIMEAMRDHFEGTPLDLSKGVGAGPYELPYRWRPLYWTLDDVEYINDRSTATQQTAFSFVAQMRGWLPAIIGGVFWFSVDDAASTVYVPMYAGILDPPHNFRVGTGDFQTFTWDSAFWVFNAVSNWTYTRYKDMIQDVRKVQGELEGRFLAEQGEVDKAALSLYQQSPRLAREYLTRYSGDRAAETVIRWRQLFSALLLKYLDGNVRDAAGNPTHPAAPEAWYRKIATEQPELLKTRKYPGEPAEE
jgi:dipeptidase